MSFLKLVFPGIKKESAILEGILKKWIQLIKNYFQKKKRKRLKKIYISQLTDLIDISDFIIISNEEKEIIKTKFKEIQEILIKSDIQDMIKYIEGNYSEKARKEIKDLL